MKAKIIISILSILFFTTVTTFCVGIELDNNSPVIGIGIDNTPLPTLLVKHLGLEQGQGIRISNIMVGSAAEEAGLERDDILISFQGEDVYDGDALTIAVQQAGIGAEVTLEVIHLGQRKTINLTLTDSSEISDWKYPVEPQIEQIWQPGSIHILKPGQKDWMKVLDDDQLPSEIKPLFKELRSFQYITDDKQYDFTIEGNPNDGDSKITINIDGDEYETTIDEIDKLPEEHREIAEQAIKEARDRNSFKIRITPRLRDDVLDNNLMSRLPFRTPSQMMPNAFDNSFFDRMEEEMRQMQEQIKELKQSQKSFIDRLIEKEKEN